MDDTAKGDQVDHSVKLSPTFAPQMMQHAVG
jgi:hypothetical protein